MKAVTQRAEQAEKVKASILDAAIPLFAHGYDSVSIQQIAAAAGCKHSLVMYHFGTKDQLWEQAAARLMQRFDRRLIDYLNALPPAQSLQQMIFNHLLAFLKALRDIPQYGQTLMSEASRESERLQWLHQNFFPSVVREMQLQHPQLEKLMLQTTLLRNSIAGALLFNVVAGPQLARSLQLEGAVENEGLYPLSDEKAETLATMLTDFLLQQLEKQTAP